MNPIKSLFLTLSLFAMLAVNAAAQCGGKTVHILLPDDWDKTTITYMWEGQYKDITLTKSGNWYSFTFPSGLSNDNMQQNSGKGQNFWFSKASSNGNPNSGQNNWIAKGQWWNKSGNAPSNTNAFFCSDFGSGSNLYISPNPNQPSSTVSDANPPNAKVLYFYPPEDEKWISGKSYITSDPDDKNAAKLMGVDPNKCGWYRVVYFNETPPDYVQIWLGATGIDKIGSNGSQSELIASGISNPTIAQIGALRLADKFSSMGDTLFFVADEGYADGWYTIDPGVGDNSRCKYELAAFIYDTDASVHPDFSCGVYQDEGKCDEAPKVDNSSKHGVNWKCKGVRKGVVQNILGTDRKIKYNPSGDKWGCWSGSEWFDKAFTSTPGVNVELCYNMPFTQAANGRYEFDSDAMVNRQGNRVGGFFPEILDQAPNNGGDYSQCSACATKRTAEPYLMIDETHISDENYRTYQSKDGDFNTGENPDASDMPGYKQKGSVWEWSEDKYPGWALWGSTVTKGRGKSKANELFCFESHADFVYDPDQEFYFTGDDDIWVFVNSHLAVDLGGAHMAAPGHVKLKDFNSTVLPADEKMVAGETYPIDIFFCDRRTTQSNVRISTNMYVTQRSSFYREFKEGNNKESFLCVVKSGGSDCASKMGMGATGETLCGDELIKGTNYKLEFYAVPTRKSPTPENDTLWLSRGSTVNRSCTGTSTYNTSFTCYNGIKVDNAVYSCGGKKRCSDDKTGAATAQVTLNGNYNIYAILWDGTVMVGKPVLIDNIIADSKASIVWGTVTNYHNISTVLKDSYGGTTDSVQSVIAGKRTPIYVASGSWGDNGFSYDSDTSMTVSVVIKAGNVDKLKIYATADKDDKNETSTVTFKDGIGTLWVEGSYDDKENTFELNVNGGKGPSMKLRVYQPVLRFVNDDISTTQITPNGFEREYQTGPSKGEKWYSVASDGTFMPPYASIDLDVYLVAWDIGRDELCVTCTFPLSTTSTSTTGKLGAGIVTDDAQRISNGRANINIAGQDEVRGTDYATWKVWGTAIKDTVEWTELQFRQPSVPNPNLAYAIDRNGDGIGDGLYVKYSSFFRDTISHALIDTTLLALLEVVWDEGDTICFHPPEYSVSDLRDRQKVFGLINSNKNAFYGNLRKYWEDKVVGDSLLYIVIDKENPGKDSKGQTRHALSTNVLTAGFNNGNGQIRSWTPYVDTDMCSGISCSNLAAFRHSGAGKTMNDSIPPVVVKAEYKQDGGKNCEKSPEGCREKLTVYLSEPVFKTERAEEQSIKNPFSYCLGRSQMDRGCPTHKIDSLAQRFAQGWDNNNAGEDWGWKIPDKDEDYASQASYKPTNEKNPNSMSSYALGAKGDSIVVLTYYSKKSQSNNDVYNRAPKADDWVKLRPDLVYRDAAGNVANPRERGVLIVGTNPSKKRQVKIAAVTADPNAPVLGGTFVKRGEEGSRYGEPYYPDWMENYIESENAKDLFKPGNVAELLPLPNKITDPDTIKAYYPGSVGTLFEVDVQGKVKNDFWEGICGNGKDPNVVCKINGKELTEANFEELIGEGIKIYASAYYHTNLGDYTAHRSSWGIECKNEIFGDSRIEGEDKGDCYSNAYNFYLAWDLKANTGRFVGAGAYVSVYKFYWQIKYDINGQSKTKTYGKNEDVEMFGVKRKAK